MHGPEDRPNYAASMLAALCADTTAAATIMRMLLALFAETTKEGMCWCCPVIYHPYLCANVSSENCWSGSVFRVETYLLRVAMLIDASAQLPCIFRIVSALL